MNPTIWYSSDLIIKCQWISKWLTARVANFIQLASEYIAFPDRALIKTSLTCSIIINIRHLLLLSCLKILKQNYIASLATEVSKNINRIPIHISVLVSIQCKSKVLVSRKGTTDRSAKRMWKVSGHLSIRLVNPLQITNRIRNN